MGGSGWFVRVVMVGMHSHAERGNEDADSCDIPCPILATHCFGGCYRVKGFI